MTITGKALVMGDDINTDALHPSQFFSLDSSRVREGFLQGVSGLEQLGRADLSNQIIIAGWNFGCGSSRETGARVFLLAGIKAIIARSFGTIFRRNVLNLGLPAFECPDITRFPESGAEVLIDSETGELDLPSLGTSYNFAPLDPYWLAVIRAGGLIQFIALGEVKEQK